MMGMNIPSNQSAEYPSARVFMNIDELSAYIGLSKRAIYQRAANRTIPSQKIGGLLRFEKSEIDKWLRSQSVTADESIKMMM